MNTSRRNLLIGASVLASGCAVLATSRARRSICGSPDDLYRRESIARIGGACIACGAITPALLAQRWPVLAALGSEEIIRLIADDFTADRVADIDGWRFAESEAVMFVAAHLGLH